MITSFTQTRLGNTTTVVVVSDLTGTIYYHWYVDGNYVDFTLDPYRTFVVPPTEQNRIECLDTNDPAFDPIANAPASFPSRRSIVWTRSLDANIDRYRVEQKIGGGAWAAIGTVNDDPRVWMYQMQSPDLADLTSHQWRVYPVDAFGNDGTVITLAAELIVRSPDSPSFSIAFDPGTTKVTFS